VSKALASASLVFVVSPGRLCVESVDLIVDLVKMVIEAGDKVGISGGKYDSQTGTVASTAGQTCRVTLTNGKTTGSLYYIRVSKWPEDV
jgi:hypothetical protein